MKTLTAECPPTARIRERQVAVENELISETDFAAVPREAARKYARTCSDSAEKLFQAAGKLTACVSMDKSEKAGSGPTNTRARR